MDSVQKRGRYRRVHATVPVMELPHAVSVEFGQHDVNALGWSLGGIGGSPGVRAHKGVQGGASRILLVIGVDESLPFHADGNQDQEVHVRV